MLTRTELVQMCTFLYAQVSTELFMISPISILVFQFISGQFEGTFFMVSSMLNLWQNLSRLLWAHSKNLSCCCIHILLQYIWLETHESASWRGRTDLIRKTLFSICSRYTTSLVTLCLVRGRAFFCHLFHLLFDPSG